MLGMLKTYCFNGKIASLPAVAAQSGYAAIDLVSELLGAAQRKRNKARIATIIDKGLEILPAVAARNTLAARELVNSFADAAQRDPALMAAVIDRGLEIAPAVAARNGFAADSLVNDITEMTGLWDGGIVCREFMRSNPTGRENRRTLVWFGATPETTRASSGCFYGSLRELQAAVKETHPEGSPHRAAYERILTAAFQAQSNREYLPTFQELVQSRAAARLEAA